MPLPELTITNATETRFLFGSFSLDGEEAIFNGAVIFGTDLTFDPETGLPTGGTIDRVELQTRGELDIRAVHAIYGDINANVFQLNAAFETADSPWFDPAHFFGSDFLSTLKTASWGGSSGDDTFTGSEHGDELRGFDGNDEIYGGDGADLIKGHTGNDSLYGGEGRDTLMGGDGNDKLYGGAEKDYLFGGGGNDSLYGGTRHVRRGRQRPYEWRQ